jgi:hypothetical protein
MSLENTFKLVSEKCLRGRPVPRSLQILWKAQEDNDPFLADALWLTLLTAPDEAEEGYTESFAGDDPDVLANVRAHRHVFERLGFFAKEDNGEGLAFDFQSGDASEPPVIELDTEGQYGWKGANLAEAIFRIAEDRDQGDDARAWLAAHDLALGDLGELGSTSQFLPSIQDYQEREYYKLRGEPREVPRCPISRPILAIRSPGFCVPQRKYAKLLCGSFVCQRTRRRVNSASGATATGASRRSSCRAARKPRTWRCMASSSACPRPRCAGCLASRRMRAR